MSETTTWWRVWLGDIEPVEVAKETDKTLTIVETWSGRRTERRVSKGAGSREYFPSREEAVAHTLARAERQVEASRARLEEAERTLAKLREKHTPAA